MSRQLFTVGPVHVEDEVLQAMTKPMITHRCKEYKALHRGIVEKMRKALDTDMDIFIVGGSATVLIEGAVRNAVSSRCTTLSNGSFGKRLIECGTANGKSVDCFHGEWGKAIRPENMDAIIDEKTEAVCWVSNESSTGVLNPSMDLAKKARDLNPDASIIIDAVTSAFAVDLNLKKLRPDALVFGTQKALALPPGLAFACVSEDLLKKAEKMQNKGFYTDFTKLKKNADDDYALTTPPVSLMYALDYQLDRILKEGMKSRYKRHIEMASLVEKWAEERFEGIFPEEGYRSKTIGVIKRGDLDFDAFHNSLKAKGYEISNGYGDVKSSTFRIGHMGDATPDGIKKLISTMDEVLEAMQ